MLLALLVEVELLLAWAQIDVLAYNTEPIQEGHT